MPESRHFLEVDYTFFTKTGFDPLSSPPKEPRAPFPCVCKSRPCDFLKDVFKLNISKIRLVIRKTG